MSDVIIYSKTGKTAEGCSEDFKETVTNGYYVDKTLFIKDFLDTHKRVTLITRPRRFGKSLNLDMFRTFFEKTEDDASVYFKDLEIWSCGERYTSEQGRYPVIYLDLKEATGLTYEKMLSQMRFKMCFEYSRHYELEESDRVDRDGDLDTYTKIIDGKADEAELEFSLLVLSHMLYDYYGVKPVILIDEYDAPFLSATDHGYYEEAVEFFNGFFSAAMKDNECLNFAVLMGVTRIAGTGVYGGFNNADVQSVLDDRYSEYFGFTKNEVRKLLADFDASDKYDEVCEWYDGYIIGHEKIFNPVSVLEYVSRGYDAQSYWVNTSPGAEFSLIAPKLTKKILSVFIDLSVGQSVSAPLNANLTCEDFNDIDNVYSVLFIAGYLKLHVPEGQHREEELDRVIKLARGGGYVPLSFVNKDIAEAYINDILKYAKGIFRLDLASECLQEAVSNRDPALIGEGIKNLVSESLSFYDDTEDFYHGFVLGLVSELRSIYAITSNREPGKGRFDVAVEPLRGVNSLPGIIMEFKVCDEEGDLPAKATEALGQIDKKDYVRDMTVRGVKDILKMGMAFCGKEVEFAS